MSSFHRALPTRLLLYASFLDLSFSDRALLIWALSIGLFA